MKWCSRSLFYAVVCMAVVVVNMQYIRFFFICSQLACIISPCHDIDKNKNCKQKGIKAQCPNKAQGPDGLCTQHSQMKQQQKQSRKEQRELANCSKCSYPNHLCSKHWITQRTKVAKEREQVMKHQLTNLNVEELTVAAARRAASGRGRELAAQVMGVNTAVMQSAAMVQQQQQQQQWQQQQQIQQGFGLYMTTDVGLQQQQQLMMQVGAVAPSWHHAMGAAAAMHTTTPTQVTTQQVATEKKKGGKQVII